jgi:hypothetical protein
MLHKNGHGRRSGGEILTQFAEIQERPIQKGMCIHPEDWKCELINHSNPSGYYITLYSVHTVYLCVSYDFHNKQQLFP